MNIFPFKPPHTPVTARYKKHTYVVSSTIEVQVDCYFIHKTLIKPYT